MIDPQPQYQERNEEMNRQQRIEELKNALKTARGALMSYQYGNRSTELAEEVIQHIDEVLSDECV